MTCKTCLHFLVHEDDQSQSNLIGQVGDCRRYPPVHVRVNNNPLDPANYRYPITPVFERCGEFSAMPPEPEIPAAIKAKWPFPESLPGGFVEGEKVYDDFKADPDGPDFTVRLF